MYLCLVYEERSGCIARSFVSRKGMSIENDDEIGDFSAGRGRRK